MEPRSSNAEPRVAIVGGGMAGLTAAWRLTDPDVKDRVGSVTVYQRGFRVGGKGASSRGVGGRIEEHGLHIWLGYYDNAFRVIRECYAELDRPATRPEAPIKTWLDAFAPAPHIGLDEQASDETWSTWTAQFSTNRLLPGEPLDQVAPTTLIDMVHRSVKLVADYYRSVADTSAPDRAAVSTALGAAAGVARILERELRGLSPLLPLGPVLEAVEYARSLLLPSLEADETATKLFQLLDIVTVQMRGLVADDLMRRGFAAIDHLDYRQWIVSHGAAPQTVDSALVRGLYNLAFSHRGGDPRRTEFPAGLGLFLSMKTFFDFKGSIFWKMQAGMGDVVMAPMYEALRSRGVRFEFFHRVEDLGLGSDGTSVDTITFDRQATLAPGVEEYHPLVDYDGLPCFPDRIDRTQLLPDEGIPDQPESFWSPPGAGEPVTLHRGEDFDEVVLAVGLGMVPHIAPKLIAANPRWKAMVDTMETVGTQAFQLWLSESEADLGWPTTGSTVTNYVDSYDTWSSMSYLLDAEGWDGPDRPKTLAYFCSSMPYEQPDRRHDPDQPQRAHKAAYDAAVEYLDHDIGHYWPNAVSDEGTFRWDLLCPVLDEGPPGSDALATQFVTANVDPSDRYVQAIPAASHVRLRPDRSGFDGLHLAGDWTDCGLNAGCIEAAVLSGIRAANSVLGLPRAARVSGGFP